MIIDNEYLISRFHLTSGAILNNRLFNETGDFNYYRVEEENHQMKLFNRTKGKDDDGEECIVEVMVGIISPDRIEYIEVMEIEKVPEHLLEIVDINEE